MFRIDEKKRVTHITETLMGKPHVLEIERLSAPFSKEKNFADKLFDAFEKEEVSEFELPALLDNALQQHKLIHVADVAYHLERNALLIVSDAKQLIYLHKFILEFSQDSKELCEESNMLFMEFLLKHTEKLAPSDRYKIFEDLFSQAIHVYDEEKIKVNPMQTIINHLYHYLCGKGHDQPVSIINLNQTLSEALISHAREKRQGGSFQWLSWHNRSEPKGETSNSTHSPSLRHSS